MANAVRACAHGLSMPNAFEHCAKPPGALDGKSRGQPILAKLGHHPKDCGLDVSAKCAMLLAGVAAHGGPPSLGANARRTLGSP